MTIHQAFAPAASLRRSRKPAAPTRFADATRYAGAARPSEPKLLFSAAAIAERVRRFQAGFPGEVAYAVKANSHPQVILAAAKAGLEVFDVASPGEIESVARLVPGARMHYHNPVKSRDEIARAFRRFGVRRFAADCAEEIAKIAEATGQASGIEVAVRFRMPAHGHSAHDFSSKFGASPEAAAELLGQVVARGMQPVLTFHPGSQCLSPAAYVRHIEASATIAAHAGVTLVALNVGGGMPVDYLGCPAPSLEQYFEVIGSAARSAFAALGVPALECEPGRALVAPAASLLTQVKLVRSANGEVFLNDGVYGALMEVYQAAMLQPPYRVIRDGAVLEGAMQEFVAFGPTCDPLDRLPNRLSLPADLKDGDHIEFGMLGAYSLATATRFNSYGGAELVHVDEVLTA